MSGTEVELSGGDDRGTSGSSTVLVGDEANAVPIQVLQSLYNEITGKSETVGKNFRDPFEISFEDVQQLHLKITQAREQYNIRASNCVITVYYLNNSRDQFSSFERFKFHSSGSTSPVESILLKYNFLIVLPRVPKPQTYSVSIRLISRICLESRIRAESYHFPAFYRLMGGNTARVDIEYVDYTVARTFLSLIDDWFSVLPRAKPQKVMLFLQANSHWIPRFARFLTAIFATFIVFDIYSRLITKSTVSLPAFGEFFLFACLGIYIAYTLSSWFAIYTERSIDLWSQISFLTITKGDEAEIRKSKQHNRKSLLNAGVGFVFTVAVSVATKVVAAVVVGWLALG